MRLCSVSELFRLIPKQACIIATIGILCSCARDAVNPLSLAPANPYSTWTPMKGNQLVSSQYCKVTLPPSFDCSELNLAELLDIALQNNPSTKQTWAQARAAAAQYGQSLSLFYPSISTNTSYLRFKNATTTANAQYGTDIANNSNASGQNVSMGQQSNPVRQGLGSPTILYTTQVGPDVTLAYTLFDFGQRTSAALAAREALYYADLTHNQEIQTIMQTVMMDTYNYLYQQALLRSDKANLANAQMSLDAANERFALGLAALGDVAQARTQYLQNKINLTTQKQNLEDAFAQLAYDLGLPSSLSFKVQPLPDQIVADPILESVDALVEKAQMQRQDLLAAQANIRSKEAILLNAKRAVYPVVGIGLDTGHYWFQKGMQEPGPHWAAQVSLSFPIFQGFFYANGIKNAEANVELARAQLFQTELGMIQSVTTSHMGVKTAASNLVDSEEYLKAAELEFDIALTGYKAGTMTILDVMSAQSSLADARSKKANSQKEWFSSLAALAYATGSLCATPDEIAAPSNSTGSYE